MKVQENICGCFVVPSCCGWLLNAVVAQEIKHIKKNTVHKMDLMPCQKCLQSRVVVIVKYKDISQVVSVTYSVTQHTSSKILGKYCRCDI